jgi:hypothetical protein
MPFLVIPRSLLRGGFIFQGRYSFALSEAVARGELRPLRDPDELDY